MWRSAICSDAAGGSADGSADGAGGPRTWRTRARPVRPGPRRGGRRPAVAGALLLALPLLAAPARGQTFLTQEEALRLAFPAPAAVERRTAFLDEAALRRAGELAGPGVEVEQRVVTYYVGRAGGETLGYAYFDAHRVRTLPEVLMVVVSPEGRVERLEVLKFAEPREYLPPDRWLEQFEGTDDPTDGIVDITGATLTSRAVGRAVRRVLALHEIIAGDRTAGDASAGRGGRG